MTIVNDWHGEAFQFRQKLTAFYRQVDCCTFSKILTLMRKDHPMSYTCILVLSLITLRVNVVSLPTFAVPCQSYLDSGYYPNQKDCLSFYQCAFGIPTLMPCGSGTAWDTSAMSCIHIAMVPNCEDNESDTTSSVLTKQFTSNALGKSVK